ncbi:MAG TPA: cytochrome c [Bryobacteraceae bacterium]|nr:cytochrome c [Bryobacteraceae bacterium]
MDRFRASVTAACCGLVLLAAIASGQSSQPGVFSADQAKHGQRIVGEKCGACHGNDLDGGQEAPALKGDPFWSEWDQQTARSLYSRIISTMPPDSPGTLDEKDVIDIVAFIVHENGVPQSSKAVLSASELNNIKLQRPK